MLQPEKFHTRIEPLAVVTKGRSQGRTFRLKETDLKNSDEQTKMISKYGNNIVKEVIFVDQVDPESFRQYVLDSWKFQPLSHSDGKREL